MNSILSLINPIVWYQFNYSDFILTNGIYTTITDYSGNNRNLTIYNSIISTEINNNPQPYNSTYVKGSSCYYQNITNSGGILSSGTKYSSANISYDIGNENNITISFWIQWIYNTTYTGLLYIGNSTNDYLSITKNNLDGTIFFRLKYNNTEIRL